MAFDISAYPNATLNDFKIRPPEGAGPKRGQHRDTNGLKRSEIELSVTVVRGLKLVPNVRGLLITMPHKNVVFHYCSTCS